MFSPTHTPPPESSSEDEEDIDLPLIDVGTPKKPKLETEVRAEQTLPTEPWEPSLPTAACLTSSSSTSNKTDYASSSTTSVAAVSASRRVFSGVGLQSDVNYRYKLEKTKKESQLMADGLKNSSPIKTECLKVTNESKRIAMKVKKLSKSLQEKTDMERKLEELRSRRGIQGIARLEEEKSTTLALEQESQTLQSNGGSLRCQRGSHSSGHAGNSLLSPSLPANPGKAIFVHSPSLISELYPPGIDVQDGGLLGDALIHGSVEDLKNIVCNQTLSLAYIARPCPTELIQWLFQLMACSDDPQVSAGALRSLTSLLQNAKRLESSSFSTPSVAEIVDVLVTLGVERNKLRPLLTGSGTRVQLMPMDEEEEEILLPAHPPCINLLNLISYISLCLQTVADYRVQHLEELVLILSSLSLDRNHAHLLKRSLQTSIHNILAAYPERVWPKAVKRLSPQLACLSPHHHDRVFLARLISGTRPREKCLLRDFCRWCLLQMVDLPDSQPQGKSCGKATSDSSEGTLDEGSGHNTNKASSTTGEEVSPCKDDRRLENPTGASCKATQTPLLSEDGKTSDCIFLNRVLTSYHRALPKEMTDEDYYKMHSLLHLLQLYAPVSDLKFPCKSSKQEFISLSRTIRATVREDPMRPITSIVKDLLIRMKLELEARSTGSTQEKLTDIFSFSS